MAVVPTGLVTHTQKVCRLYKRCLRCVADWYHEIPERRYESILVRERFEVHRNIIDDRIAKVRLLEGEEELFQHQHTQPRKFPESADGVAYERDYTLPDSVLDYWHPLEKARFPKYFERRELLKKEYEQFYYKMFPESPKTLTDRKTSKHE